MIIFNGSFFVGVIWIIICYVSDKMRHKDELSTLEIEPVEEETDVFLDKYDLRSYSNT